jgi:hypothetical protein
VKGWSSLPLAGHLILDSCFISLSSDLSVNGAHLRVQEDKLIKCADGHQRMAAISVIRSRLP